MTNDKKLTYTLSGDKLTNGESKVLGNIQMNEKVICGKLYFKSI